MADRDSPSVGANLAPLLRDAPHPAVFGVAGVAGLGLGLYWLLAVSWWWVPLKLLAFPALGLGLGALSVAALKMRHAPAIGSWRPPALEDESTRAGAKVRGALDAADAPMTVDELVSAAGIDGDDVVLGLGFLNRQGLIDEILDEQSGEFRYILLDAPDGDGASHISLGQRLAQVEKARGGRR